VAKCLLSKCEALSTNLVARRRRRRRRRRKKEEEEEKVARNKIEFLRACPQ
jgi:hypothetical protein